MEKIKVKVLIISLLLLLMLNGVIIEHNIIREKNAEITRLNNLEKATIQRISITPIDPFHGCERDRIICRMEDREVINNLFESCLSDNEKYTYEQFEVTKYCSSYAINFHCGLC